jgi:hypothetical protein
MFMQLTAQEAAVIEQMRRSPDRPNDRCEDYPCCGHTDGLGCNYVPDYTYINAHAGCDHEIGECWKYDDYDEEED